MSVIIPTNNNPTPASRKGWVGGAWGELAGGLIGGILGGPIGSAVGVAAGLGIGYVVGNTSGAKNQQIEIQTGKKEVREPKFWNWGAAQGFAIGEIVAVGLSFLGHNPLIGTLATASWLGGLIVGGSMGKNKMRQELVEAQKIADEENQRKTAATVSQAVQQNMQQQASVSAPAPVQETPVVQTVTPEPQPQFVAAEEKRRAETAAAAEKNTGASVA